MLTLEEASRPFAYGQQLWDVCQRWMGWKIVTPMGLIIAITLEQFIAQLPRGTVKWVQCHRPPALDRAIELAEDHLPAFLRADAPAAYLSSRPSPPPSLRKRGPIPLKPFPYSTVFPCVSSPPYLSVSVLPQTPSLFPQMDPSVPTKTGSESGQVHRHSGKAMNSQNQHFCTEAGF